MPSRVYSLKAWQRVRRLYLLENPLCKHCAEAGLIVPAHDVDHIIPIAKGGAWFDPANLQGLCVPCHSVKSRVDAGYEVRAFQPGCDASGKPIDPRHPWNRRD